MTRCLRMEDGNNACPPWNHLWRTSYWSIGYNNPCSSECFFYPVDHLPCAASEVFIQSASVFVVILSKHVSDSCGATSQPRTHSVVFISHWSLMFYNCCASIGPVLEMDFKGTRSCSPQDIGLLYRAVPFELSCSFLPWCNIEGKVF